jgi:ribosome biogenesis GTPase A
MMDINWYPGHMAKARRMMEDNLKAVDFVIEVVDARIPWSSRNPDFDDLFKTKARVIVLNKADLADPARTRQWLKWYAGQGTAAVEFVATKLQGREALLKMMKEASEEKVRRMAERGAKKTVRALVAGIPNTGKSALINAMAGSSSARTGDRPGVTRGRQLIRITPWMELMDTPGVLWPKLDDAEGALNLAFTGAIKEEIMDPYRLSLELIDALAVQYPEAIRGRYKLTETQETAAGTLVAIALKRGCLISGGEPDEERAARLVLDEMKSGKLGRLTMEMPHENNNRQPFEL